MLWRRNLDESWENMTIRSKCWPNFYHIHRLRRLPPHTHISGFFKYPINLSIPNHCSGIKDIMLVFYHLCITFRKVKMFIAVEVVVAWTLVVEEVDDKKEEEAGECLLIAFESLPPVLSRSTWQHSPHRFSSSAQELPLMLGPSWSSTFSRTQKRFEASSAQNLLSELLLFGSFRRAHGPFRFWMTAHFPRCWPPVLQLALFETGCPSLSHQFRVLCFSAGQKNLSLQQ